jgi:hypothetical protein
MSDRDDRPTPELPETPETRAPAAASAAPSGAHSEAGSPAGRRPSRPDLSVERIAVWRDHAGYSLRLEPSDLANLRELPGARGKTDAELGAEFLAAQCERLVAAIAGDLPAPAALRVLVDPYSRQAFLAHGDRVRGIVSF